MYCEKEAAAIVDRLVSRGLGFMDRGARVALGQVPVTAYVVGGTSSHPCQDFAFRLMNRAACAAMGYNGTPTPAEVKETTYTPPPEASPEIIYAAPAEPEPEPEPLAQDFGPDAVAPGAAPGPSLEFFEMPGAAPVSVDVSVAGAEAAEPARGFGLVEAIGAAGLAFLIARSWDRR